jgi:hypothetical protein
MRSLILTTVLLTFLGLRVSAQQKSGKASFITKNHSFGILNEKQGTVTYIFTFKNTGTSLLTLTDVQTPCRCTTANWSEKPIKPGKKGSIKVTYHFINRPGDFDESITVITDGIPATQVLNIRGTVIGSDYNK